MKLSEGILRSGTDVAMGLLGVGCSEALSLGSIKQHFLQGNANRVFIPDFVATPTSGYRNCWRSVKDKRVGGIKEHIVLATLAS
jgi:hypothetical protein